MTKIREQVQRTQRQLWLNRWFIWLTWTSTTALALLAIILFVVKLMGWSAPLGWIALGLLLASGMVATVVSLARRADAVTAAAALDDAAGLRERISTGLYCETSQDPYARAVVADAERISASLSVRRHIPLRTPRSCWYTGLAAFVVFVLLLLPTGWIDRQEAKADLPDRDVLERRDVAIKERINLIKKEAKVNEALKDNPAMNELIAGLDELAKDPAAAPDARRHEAVKKLDKAADALRKQRSSEKFDRLAEMKKMLRSIKPEGDKDSPAHKLSEALAEGDFKSANEAIQALQQQLADMKSADNAEATQKMQEQLARLAAQLEKAADTSQLQKKLEQAGLSPEDAKKMLEKAAKGDMSELEKQLAKLGLPQQQMSSLMQQMRKRAQACNACRNMSGALSQAASAMQQGQNSDASRGLQSAGGQLGELEMLEQEMNQLESQMSALESAKDSMNQCSQCQGTGTCGGQPCRACQGSGFQTSPSGMGPRGQGRGGLAPESPANVAFKVERTRVFTGPGRVIGQFLVEGEQVKGEAATKLVEVIAAEERNATDAINRDRIPRQYQQSVKEYFRRIQKTLTGETPNDDTQGDGAKAGSGEGGAS